MKKSLAILLSFVIILSVFVACSKQVEEPTTTTTTTETTTEPPKYCNPFTGEEGFDKAVLGVRPVAIVVENLSPARPQWGIKTPDIICEGEVEGGISRMLWLYADINDVPEKVGPIRSARPSYVQFSTYFDAVFIHWGGSHSKSGYTGGYETIKKLGVDDIDGMNGGALFGRDKTRSVSSEHRGILNGKKIKDKIKDKGYRTKLADKTTEFTFNEDIKDAGETVANSVGVKFSNRTDTRKLTYSTEDHKYHTNDWKTDVAFENLIILMADSKYITVPYKGSSTTYLNYSWTSGKGYYISNGKACEISWDTSDGVLNLKDSAGAPLSINQGNSYIGFASSNHEGKVSME